MLSTSLQVSSSLYLHALWLHQSRRRCFLVTNGLKPILGDEFEEESPILKRYTIHNGDFKAYILDNRQMSFYAFLKLKTVLSKSSS